MNSLKEILYNEELFPKTKKTLSIFFILVLWYFQFTDNRTITFALIISVSFIGLIYFVIGTYLFRRKKDFIYLTIWIILLLFGISIYLDIF